jgi:hypothetical protein
MSLLLLGKTKCSICEKTINKEDIYYGFPHFVANILDPLHFFSDRCFHLACLENSIHGEIAMQYAELGNLKIKPENRKCIVTGELITRQKDHILIGYLTSDESSYLHRFNFTHINVLNLTLWNEREHVIKELIKFRESGLWLEDGNRNYLSKLIDVLKFKLDASTLW